MERLYTVNKWNKQMFQPAVNLFGQGGDYSTLYSPSGTPYIDWSNGVERAMALGQTRALTTSMGQGATMDLNQSNLNLSQDISSTRGYGKIGKSSEDKKQMFGDIAGGIANAIPEEPIKIGNRTYKYGAWDVADPLSNLAGNYSNKGGDMLNKAGISMFKAGASSGNPWVMLAGGTTKAMGSLVNFAFGGTDAERLKNARQGIDYYKNFKSIASTNEDVYEPLAMNNFKNPYWGGLFRDRWAERKNTKLHNQWVNAELGAYSNMRNNVYNVEHNKRENSLRRKYDFGGPINSPYNIPFGYSQSDASAVNYDLATSYLAMKDRQIDGKSTNIGNNVFASGGKIHINPKNKGKFNATKKRTGKTTEELTHSKNPLTRKRAIFAQNARKWRHDYGGYLDAMNTLNEAESNLYAGGGPEDVAPADATYVSKPLTYEKPRPQLMKKVTRHTLPVDQTVALAQAEANQEILDAALDNFFAGKPMPKVGRKLEAITRKLGEGDEEYIQQLAKTPLRRLTAPFNEGREEYLQTNRPFAFGGDLQTNGSDFPTGLITIGAGGSHEENPYEGVQMGVDREGTPNLVEEDEVVYEDYVFSNRIYCDEETKQKFHISKSRKITFAQLAKKLEKEIAERPNDPISEAGFKAQMETLKEEQERQKKEMEAERAREAFEALPPEEQVAMMDRMAQQEQMAQQAMQEQAMAQEAAQQQGMVQPSSEEAAMAQEQMIPETEAAVAPQMQAYGGRLYPDGGYLWDNFWTPVNEYSKLESANGRYQIDNKTLTKEQIKELENSPEYKAFTDYILNKATDEERKQYFKWIDDNTGGKRKYLDKDGNLTKDWKERFTTSRTDGLYGLQHYTPIWQETEALAAGNPEFVMYESQLGTPMTDQSNGFTVDNTQPIITKGNGDAIDKLEQIRRAINEGSSVTGEEKDDKPHKLSRSIVKKYGEDWFKEQAKALGIDEKYLKNFYDKFSKTDATANINAFNEAYADAQKAKALEDYVNKKKAAKQAELFNKDNGIYRYSDDRSKIMKAKLDENGDRMLENGKPVWEIYDGSINDLLNSYNTNNEFAEGFKWNGADARVVEYPDLGRKWEDLRYAGLLGPTVGLGLQVAGVGRPSYKRLDAAVTGMGEPVQADVKYIGNYLKYEPMDIWYGINNLNANSRATDRQIMNNASPIGTKIAGLVANSYANQIANGNMFRQNLEYNDVKKAQVEGFNRGTDQFNATAYNQNSLANAQMANAHKQAKQTLALKAAMQRLDSDAGWYNSLYGNIGNLFKAVGKLGEDNFNWNRYADIVNKFGIPGWNKAAEGGKIKKKKKRGFTY